MNIDIIFSVFNRLAMVKLILRKVSYWRVWFQWFFRIVFFWEEMMNLFCWWRRI